MERVERVYICVLWDLLTSLLVSFEKGGKEAATRGFGKSTSAFSHERARSVRSGGSASNTKRQR